MTYELLLIFSLKQFDSSSSNAVDTLGLGICVWFNFLSVIVAVFLDIYFSNFGKITIIFFFGVSESPRLGNHEKYKFITKSSKKEKKKNTIKVKTL